MILKPSNISPPCFHNSLFGKEIVPSKNCSDPANMRKSIRCYRIALNVLTVMPSPSSLLHGVGVVAYDAIAVSNVFAPALH